MSELHWAVKHEELGYMIESWGVDPSDPSTVAADMFTHNQADACRFLSKRMLWMHLGPWDELHPDVFGSVQPVEVSALPPKRGVKETLKQTLLLLFNVASELTNATCGAPPEYRSRSQSPKVGDFVIVAFTNKGSDPMRHLGWLESVKPEFPASPDGPRAWMIRHLDGTLTRWVDVSVSALAVGDKVYLGRAQLEYPDAHFKPSGDFEEPEW